MEKMKTKPDHKDSKTEKKSVESPKIEETRDSDFDDNDMDFGGLPEGSDLRRNLGCGG